MGIDYSNIGIVIEAVLVFGGVMAFGFWQLWELKKLKKQREERGED